MATLQHTSPASLRTGNSAARESRGSFAPDPRPYLVTGQHRKSVISAQQYLALFPHEAEDARLTGSTRSLFRRLLALNLPGASNRIEPSSGYTSPVIKGTFTSSNSKIA
jgi:hypothetical protein